MTRLTSAPALAACLVTAATGVALTLALPAIASAQGSSTVLGAQRPVSTDTPLVQEAAAFLAEQVGGTLASVDTATSGGSPAYHLTITLEGGARWSGVVGLHSDHSFTLSGQPTQLEDGETDTGTNDGSDHSGDDDNEAAGE